MKKLIVMASAAILLVSACKKDDETTPIVTTPITTTPTENLSVTVENLTGRWNIYQIGYITDSTGVISYDGLYEFGCASNPDYYAFYALDSTPNFLYEAYTSKCDIQTSNPNNWLLNDDNSIVIGDSAEVWEVLLLTNAKLTVRERTNPSDTRVITFNKG